MTELEHSDWMHLLYKHYNYIHIFDNNSKYSYKPLGISKKNDTFVLTFDVVETNNTQYEPTEDYRTDTIFNEEPRILQMGEECPSFKI